MTIHESIKVLENLKACQLRTFDDCASIDCADCDLHVKADESLKAYDMAIEKLKEAEEGKMQVIKCDRCGKIMGDLSYLDYHQIAVGRHGQYEKPIMDLCDECYSSFEEWFGPEKTETLGQVKAPPVRRPILNDELKKSGGEPDGQADKEDRI